MNYPRVNLLRKSEQRYQGAVSRRFIAVGVVVTPILLVAVLSGIKLVQYTGLKADLKASQEIWNSLEPKLELYNKEKRSLNTNEQVLKLFNGWQASQLSLVDLLDDIQDAVPDNIQFTRLMLRGEVAPRIYAAAEDMRLEFTLQIDGSSQGEVAEEDVWRFHKDLLAAEGIQHVFDMVELTDMRKRQNNSGLSVCEFRIEGSEGAGGAR